MKHRLSSMRRDYQLTGLLESDVSTDPIVQFEHWFEQARARDGQEANAMTLATCNAAGQPAARTVLLKAFDEHGFVFYTNLESRKAADMEENPRVSLLFWWRGLERQVRIEGPVERVPKSMADAYFAERPRGSQIGAWASRQSTILDNREQLEQRIADAEQEYEGRDIPCPPFWGGFRVRPQNMEFWQGRASRLHDRLRYRREGEHWLMQRLSP